MRSAPAVQVFIIYPTNNPPPVPSFSAASIVNAASGAAGLADGGLVSLYGSNILPNFTGIAGASSLPLPSVINGVSITIAGRPVPILAVANVNGNQQINFQVPFGLAGPSWNLPLIVTSGGVQSSPLSVNHRGGAQPGVFLINGQGAFFHADYSPVTPASPAAPGETIFLYATGLGAVSPGRHGGHGRSDLTACSFGNTGSDDWWYSGVNSFQRTGPDLDRCLPGKYNNPAKRGKRKSNVRNFDWRQFIDAGTDSNPMTPRGRSRRQFA